MHSILHNSTNKQPEFTDIPRSFRGRKASTTHSPDGYLAHDELAHTWRPLSIPDPGSIRSRSRTHIGLTRIDTRPALQDVAEEEDPADPHAWRAPGKTDSRGPCPALGALSNHGYLPRDGRNIGIWQMVLAIREGYGGSWAYALIITIVSYVILRLGGIGKGWLHPTIDLGDLAAHGVLEHDGSLTHADVDEDEVEDKMHHRIGSRSPIASSVSSTAVSPILLPHSLASLFTPSTLFALFSPSFLFSLPRRILLAFIRRLPLVSRFTHPHTHTYASSRPSRLLIRQLLADSASGTHFTLADVARARVRRSASTRPIPSRLIRQFADGEFAMTIDILGHDGRVELDVLRAWLEEERLPRGWRPSHVQGLWRTHVVTERVQKLMEGLERYQKKGREVQTVIYE